MLLGLGTYALAWSIGVPGHPAPSRPLDALGVLGSARTLGLGLVQFADNLSLLDIPAPSRSALVQAARSAGIAIEVGGRGLTDDNLRHHLDLASECGARLVRMVIDGPGFEPALDEVIGRLSAITPLLERRDLTLGLENHDRLRVAEFVAILEAVGSPRVGICLDTVNSFGAGEGLATVVDALAPHTVNLHLKDYAIRRLDHRMGFHVGGTPAGEGDLPVGWLLRRLAPFGRCHSAVIELWPPPQADGDASAALEQDWLRKSVHNLRTLFPLPHPRTS